jgi:hypothetical protein
MSAREDQPATVPPPAGEDDAYSAATKVGAMPAEVMAKLRAEGLLPDLEPEPPPTSAKPPPRPPVPRPMPSGRPSSPASNAPEDERPVDSNLPVFHSVPPPMSGTSGLPRANRSDPPDPPDEEREMVMDAGAPLVVNMGTPPTFPQTVETPIAFATPPPAPVSASGAPPQDVARPVAAPPSLSRAYSQLRQVMAGRGGRLIGLLVVLVALLVVLFVVAFMRQRR